MRKFCSVKSLTFKTWEREFRTPFESMIYLPLRLDFVSANDNDIEFKFQCRINHRPEWKVEFSIPMQTPFRHFSSFEVL